MDGGEETRRRLVVAGGNGAKALERVEAALDPVPERVELPVEPGLHLVRWVRGDDGLHASREDRGADLRGAVARVGDAGFAAGVLDQLGGLQRFVPVPLGERDVEGLAVRRGDRVDLGRNASSRTAQMISSDPPFPPAASWCARTIVASRSEPVSSTSMASSLKSRSQTPRFAHREKRL